MLHQTQHDHLRLQQISDGLLGALSVALAYALRSEFPWLNLPDLEAFSDYIWLLLLTGIFTPVMLSQQGFYNADPLTSRVATIFKIMRGCTYAVLGLVLFLFIVRVQFARSVIILAGAFAAFLIYARHEFTQTFVAKNPHSQSQRQRRVLWIGKPNAIAQVRDTLTHAEQALIDPVAEIDPQADIEPQLTDSLHCHSINAVILLLTGLPPATIDQIVQACDHEGIEIIIHPGLTFASPFRLTVDQLGGQPVMYYRAQSARPFDLALKQGIDYLGGALLFVLLSPLIIFCAILLRLSSRAPILFRQERAGLNGRHFVMYKFRTMRDGAENEKADLSEQNEMSGPVFKIADDPRVTRLGRFLRRHSLDELPQLWNVLRGEMSLVGPRPLPLDEVKHFENNTQRRRLSVKPGLTCLWQIRGRNDISSFEDWVRLDLEYIDQWSLWLDLKILLATVPVAIFGRGGR